MAKNKDAEVINEGPLAEALIEAAVDGGESVIEECFITDTGQTVSSEDLYRAKMKSSFRSLNSETLHRDTKSAALLDVSKTVDGSAQSDKEIGRSRFGETLSQIKLVDPPYPPELLGTFLEVDETHYRCVRTKVTDAVGRDYIFDPVALPGGKPFDPALQSDTDKIAIESEVKLIKDFIDECNDIIGFDGVLERAGMDYEAVGWSAIEVVRSRDMKIRSISHIPASRDRVILRWKGFVDVL